MERGTVNRGKVAWNEKIFDPNFHDVPGGLIVEIHIVEIENYIIFIKFVEYDNKNNVNPSIKGHGSRGKGFFKVFCARPLVGSSWKFPPWK